MEPAFSAGDDIVVLPHHEPAGAFGFLPMHAYLIKATEPVLVDTGVMPEAGAFLDTLRGQLDLEDLRWILLTHEDLDHAGAVVPLMQAAPNARLVLSFLAISKGATGGDAALMPRLVIATPGQAFDAGGRRFGVVRPPVYDSSATVAFFDQKTGTLFSADAFGGLVPQPAQDIDALGDEAYEDGCETFTLANSTWLHDVDPARLARNTETVRRLGAETVMSSHAAPLRGRTERLCDHLASLPARPPVEMPDNAAFQQLLASMKAGGARA